MGKQFFGKHTVKRLYLSGLNKYLTVKNLRQNYINLAYNLWQSANNSILSPFLAFVKLNKPLVSLSYLFRIVFIISILCPFLLYAQHDVKKIVIDAGHGGKDEGVSGKYSKEKELTLSLALQTAKLLNMQFPEVEVLFTRTTDHFVSLKERAKIANQAHADLFISLHCNYSMATDSGTETYVLGNSSEPASLHVAQQENTSILFEEQYKKEYNGFEPALAKSYVSFKMKDDSFQLQNLDLAQKLQDYLEYYTPLENRGVKQAPLWLLNQLSMPAVMIQVGFLSYSMDEHFLNKMIGKENISRAIVLALGDYIEGLRTKLPNKPKDKPKSALTTRVHTNTPTKPNSQNKVSGYVYKVQFLSLSQNKILSDKTYQPLQPVESYFYKGMWRYVTGNCGSRAEADKLKTKLREKGFKDAFVVAFKNGKRI